MAKAVGHFFSSEGNAASDDPLVDIVRRDPYAARRFIRTVMVFSGCGSAIVCAACGVFLFLYWGRCGACDRPLRWWILIHTALQLAQVPVRFVFLAKLRGAERMEAPADGTTGENSLEACVCEFTASPAWRASKNVSLFTYGWFVLGIVWVVNAGECKACPGIYRMTISVIFQAVGRALLALLCFRSLFPSADRQRSGAQQLEAATAKEIAALPLCRYAARLSEQPGQTSCAVCLSDYEEGDNLRRLPCGHHFHRRCADKWLRRSKRCPLCMQCIDKESCLAWKGAKEL